MPHTILVLLFGDLGDMLLTVPALRAVRRRFAGSSVVVMAKAGPGSYLVDLGLVDEVIDVDKHALDRLRSVGRPATALRLWRLVRSLRRRRVDMLLVFQHFTTRWGVCKYAGLALASAAPIRAGLDNGRGWFLTHRFPDRGYGAMHESQYWLQVAALVGAEGGVVLEAAVSSEDRATADRLLPKLAGSSGRTVAIHPGVGWYGPGRQWGAQRFAEAADLLRRGSPICLVVVGSEADAGAAAEVSAQLGPGVIDLVGRTSTGELAAVLERCNLLLSNDSGVAHLAAAVGTPTLTVFGPSNDAAWRPLGGQVVAADIPCRPCFYRDFEVGLRRGCATRECLSLVTPATVADTARAMLEGRA